MIGKIFGLVVVVIVFTVLMLGIQYVHFQFLPVNVVFYSALYDALVALGVLAALMAIGLITARWSWFERIQGLAICGLLGYCFAISVPTVVDRSLSMYILEKLAQRGGAIQHDAFEEIFQNEYMVEHRLVDVRLTEQEESGTIRIEQRGGEGLADDCVILTPRGEMIAEVTRFYRQNFLPKTRLLAGEYTDDLTDPFRTSAAQVDYAC